MRRPNPITVTLIAAVLALLLVGYVFAGGSRKDTDKLTDQQVAGRAVADPKGQCGSQETYDLIKRDLFRRAAQAGASDKAAFDRLYANSNVSVDSPRLRSHDEAAGRINCTGLLALDPPPDFEPSGEAGTMSADIAYSLQRAADGSGDVVTLSNAEALITWLASLARAGGEPVEVASSEPATAQATGADLGSTVEPPSPARPSPPERAPVVAREATPAVAQRSRSTASPSFNCHRARTRGEIAVCGNAGLASLDRQMASQFNRSVSRGTAEQRAHLQRTRGRFLARRDSCGSTACMAEAYRARMKEIAAITSTPAPAAPSASPLPRIVTPNPAAPRPAAAGPSFNCQFARTRGEIAVCGDAGLARLDREMAAQFSVGMSSGTSAQRELLQRTRRRFISNRDSCRSQRCVAASYQGRFKEISDIMTGRWKVY